MARQGGIVELEGTIGNLTFYKSQDGFMAKRKSKIAKERLLNDPSFVRFRESQAEFQRAHKSSVLMLRFIRESISRAMDNRVQGRLTSRMKKIVNSDQSNVRGLRTVGSGDLSMLVDFEFNKLTGIHSALPVGFVPSIDRVTGQLKIVVPSYKPVDVVSKPQLATHYRLIAIGMEADFDGGDILPVTTPSGYILIDATATAPLTLTCAATANSTLPLILAFGIEFYVDTNGVKYPLSDDSHSACAIVKIEA